MTEKELKRAQDLAQDMKICEMMLDRLSLAADEDFWGVMKCYESTRVVMMMTKEYKAAVTERVEEYLEQFKEEFKNL